MAASINKYTLLMGVFGVKKTNIDNIQKHTKNIKRLIILYYTIAQ